MKAGEAEWRVKAVAIWVGCCVGDPWGELLASEERSEAELWMEMSCCGGGRVSLWFREGV